MVRCSYVYLEFFLYLFQVNMLNVPHCNSVQSCQFKSLQFALPAKKVEEALPPVLFFFADDLDREAGDDPILLLSFPPLLILELLLLL